jgi:hypothetical protein
MDSLGEKYIQKETASTHPLDEDKRCPETFRDTAQEEGPVMRTLPPYRLDNMATC